MRLRRGQIVQVDFLDHCEGGSTPMVCTVFGRLRDLNRQVIVVVSWEIPARKDRCSENENRFVIVRSTIQRIAVLHE